MDPRIVPLYYLSSLAGLVMVLGGIWLLYKEKIYIDRESKQVTEIETPVGKFKTNVPALALFALGFFPLIYPLVKSATFVEEVRLKGSVTSSRFPVTIYAVIRSDSLLQGSDFSLQLPRLAGVGEEYKIIYVVGNAIFEDRADLSKRTNGEVLLPAKDISLGRTAEFVPDLTPVPPDFR